jgi:hypothetical protein
MIRLALAVIIFLINITPAFAFGKLNNYAVGWYHYIGAPTKLKERITDAGANTILVWPATFSVSTSTTMLNQANSLGIQAILSVVGNPGQTTASTYIDSMASHPALIGWYVADEPEEFGDPPSYMYPLVSGVLPHLPSLVIHYSAQFANGWVNLTDMLMLDHYPGYGLSAAQQTPFHSRIGDAYDDWKYGVDWAKTNTKQGFIAVAEGFNDDRNMDNREYRYYALSAVAAGADALIFWHCDPEDEPNWNTADNLRLQINQLFRFITQTPIGPAMKSTETNDTAHYRGVNDNRVLIQNASSSNLVYRYGTTATHQVILAVNLSNHNGNNSGTALNNVRFKFPGSYTGTVTVIQDYVNETSPWQDRTLATSADGFFTDSFAPYAVHAYLIPLQGNIPNTDFDQDGDTDFLDYLSLIHSFGQTVQNQFINLFSFSRLVRSY